MHGLLSPFLFGFIFLAFVGHACSEAVQEKSSGPYVAQVLDYEPAESPSQLPRYILREKELPSVDTLGGFKGRGLEYLVRTQITQQLDSTGAQQLVLLDSKPAELDYLVEGDTLFPLNQLTATAFTSYMLFQDMFTRFNEFFGESFEAFQERSGSFQVHLYPNVQDATSFAVLKRNAAYSPQLGGFALFGESRSEKVPLNMNIQVISHEFGHALFDTYFFKNESKTCSATENNTDIFFPGRLETEYAMRGVNEGFADLVSLAFSGSANVLGGSLGGALSRAVEDRNFSNLDFTFSNLTSDFQTDCVGSFYCIGSLFAKAIKTTYESTGVDLSVDEQRQVMMRELIAALSSAKETMEAEPDLMPIPSARISACAIRKNFDYDGRVLAAFLRAFGTGLPETRQPKFCESMIETFGDSGFSETARASLCGEES